jgi:DNA-binding protein Alba
LESNTVFVGNKPVMTYVLSVISRVNSGGNEVTLKARGRAITTAVDTAQIAKRRFMNKNEGTAPAKSPEAASEAAPASETGTAA